jgi:competence protein ComEC
VSRVRYVLRERLLLALEGRPNAGIIVALVLGDGEQISAENWELFTQTGTNHLIVISGLHIAFVAWMCHGLVAGLVRLSPLLLLRLPAQQWGAVAGVTGAVLYSLLAGFSVPTQRSCVMVLVFMGTQLLARRVSHSFSFCLALLLVMAGNPMSVLGAGFWLSFGAVGTLLLAYNGLRTLHHRAPVPGKMPADSWTPDWAGLWLRWAHPQWVISIGMTVPMAVWMQQLSLLSPVANVLAIPLVSLLVVPLCLLGSLLLFVWLPVGSAALHLADCLLGVFTAGLQALVGAPLPVLWEFRGTTLPELLLAMAGSVMLLLPRSDCL